MSPRRSTQLSSLLPQWNSNQLPGEIRHRRSMCRSSVTLSPPESAPDGTSAEENPETPSLRATSATTESPAESATSSLNLRGRPDTNFQRAFPLSTEIPAESSPTSTNAIEGRDTYLQPALHRYSSSQNTVRGETYRWRLEIYDTVPTGEYEIPRMDRSVTRSEMNQSEISPFPPMKRSLTSHRC